MRQSGWYRLQVGVLCVGMAFWVSCAAPYQPAQRRAAYTRTPSIYGVPQVLEVQPYLSPFGNILIPGELSELSNHTTILEAGGEKTGFVVYTGRISKTAVEVFFRGELKQKGWELVTAFSSTPTTVLLFNRRTRWCVICLDERGPATDLRLGVSQDLGLAPRLLGH